MTEPKKTAAKGTGPEESAKGDAKGDVQAGKSPGTDKEAESPALTLKNPNLVYAKNQDGRRARFSRTEWAELSKTKSGWVEEVEAPPEAKALGK